MAEFFKRPKPLVLVSMDGVGVAPPGPGNAVTLADTKNLDKLWPTYPHTYLEASGLNVGLPSGTDGNSEVGHMTMGAGKVIFQSLPRIDNSIRNQSFFENPTLKEAFDHAKKNNANVHLMGLFGTGLVHASFEHFEALMKLAVQEKINGDKLFIHAFTDGRDSATNAALEVLDKVEGVCAQRRVGKLASIIGRSFAMDRNRNWQKIKVAYDMLVNGDGTKTKNWKKSLEESYKKNIFDEYLEPIILEENFTKIGSNDSVIFFNFRPDRAYELTYVFESPDFKDFQRIQLENLFFVGMADYENGYPTRKAFPPERVVTPMGKVLSDAGIKQLRIAESEKFPHVTYFFNGQNKDIYPGETWMEVPSPKDVATYDQKPEMSQVWVTDILIDKINSDQFDFCLVNFAGPDMVAHTGVIDATIKAMETCDDCIGRIVDAVLKKDGIVVITSDHGNAEEMISLQTNTQDTKHSVNQVPLIIIGKQLGGRELPVGGLADVSPTIIKLLGLEIPAEMTGRNLLG